MLVNFTTQIVLTSLCYDIWFQDHMRKAGDVCFAEVSRDSEGTPSFQLLFLLTLNYLLH